MLYEAGPSYFSPLRGRAGTRPECSRSIPGAFPEHFWSIPAREPRQDAPEMLRACSGSIPSIVEYGAAPCI